MFWLVCVLFASVICFVCSLFLHLGLKGVTCMPFLSFISLVEKGMWYLESCCHFLNAVIEVPGPTLWNPVQLDQDSYQYRLPEIQTSLNLHVYCDLKKNRW